MGRPRSAWRVISSGKGQRRLNLDSLRDFADEAANEIAKFKVSVILSPQKMMLDEHCVGSLKWNSIRFGDSELNKVPDDKRGVYAFAICRNNDVLPPHGYILYIGIAGHDSKRTLRSRYRDYLNARKVMKRARIARMIGTWCEVLRFFFAPVDDDVSPAHLKMLEKYLNTALMPPFSVRDMDADTRMKRSAFP